MPSPFSKDRFSGFFPRDKSKYLFLTCSISSSCPFSLYRFLPLTSLSRRISSADWTSISEFKQILDQNLNQERFLCLLKWPGVIRDCDGQCSSSLSSCVLEDGSCRALAWAFNTWKDPLSNGVKSHVNQNLGPCSPGTWSNYLRSGSSDLRGSKISWLHWLVVLGGHCNQLVCQSPWQLMVKYTTKRRKIWIGQSHWKTRSKIAVIVLDLKKGNDWKSYSAHFQLVRFKI